MTHLHHEPVMLAASTRFGWTVVIILIAAFVTGAVYLLTSAPRRTVDDRLRELEQPLPSRST